MDTKKQSKPTKKGEGNPEAESKTPPWMTAAALIVTVINGAIAFYGWNSAKAITDLEQSAKTKLDAIQSVVERGYIQSVGA